jgi:cellulose synthase/poly-beta-1,6-N-acetylglucosamine synthase-like glycosyltransferase
MVSVVIATRNYARFLPAAVESALSQTFPDLELVIVDDGSTDETSAVVQTYLSDARVRYLRTSHRGASAARNTGLRLVRAPLVAFLDADDSWMPAKLVRQVALFQRDPALGVAYSRRRLIDQQGRFLEYQQPRLHRGWVLPALFGTNFICFSTAVVRRSVFDDVGFFDESLPLAIDYDLWLRVALNYRFDYVDEPLACYRTGHASLSVRDEERQGLVLGIMQRFFEEHGGPSTLDPAVFRLAQVETYCRLGLARRQRSRWAALPCYLRALFLSPLSGRAWKGLGSVPLPEVVRRSLRWALGKPLDWSVRCPLPSSPRDLGLATDPAKKPQPATPDPENLRSVLPCGSS